MNDDRITASEASEFFSRFYYVEDRLSEAYSLLEDMRMVPEPDFPDCKFKCGFDRWLVSGWLVGGEGEGFELYGESWFRGEKDGSATHYISFGDVFDRFDEWKQETKAAIEQAKRDKEAAAKRKQHEDAIAAEAKERAELERLRAKYG